MNSTKAVAVIIQAVSPLLHSNPLSPHLGSAAGAAASAAAGAASAADAAGAAAAVSGVAAGVSWARARSGASIARAMSARLHTEASIRPVTRGLFTFVLLREVAYMLSVESRC